MKETRKGRKTKYRALTIPERDLLFALYDKHGGNKVAMSRDPDCIFKSNKQISYYANYYQFQSRLAHERIKRAKLITDGLSDAKMQAIKRAMEMIMPRQVIVKRKDHKTGSMVPILDSDQQPIYEEIYPTEKEIKVAWEILKTELGEATSVSKTDLTSKGKQITGNSIIFRDFSETEHGAETDSE